MSFKTLSAILRNDWLIHEDFAKQHLGLAIKLANGETVDFGLKRDESPEPVLISLGSGSIDMAAAVYGVTPKSNLTAFQPGTIAQVNIQGPVLKYGDACSYGSTDYADLIDRLAANGNIAGILLNIDSPGGQASGTTMLADSIKAATRTKPVVGVINDGMAASAAMWIASACSEVYTTKKTDQVGSIGVFTTLADWYGYAKEQGLQIRDIYAPQSSDKNGSVREALAGNDGPIQQDLADLADAFINAIQTNRAGKVQGTDWATGKMFKSKDAAKMGLIDGTKPYPQVIKRVEQLAQNRTIQNQNNMTAFAKIMALAGITSISVVDGGFLVSEETLNALENKLTETETLQSQLTEKDQQIQQLSGAQATIQDLENKIQAKDAQIAELSKKPAQDFTGSKTPNGDHLEGTIKADKYQTSYDREKAELREKYGLKK